MSKPRTMKPLVKIGILGTQQSEETAEAIHNMNKKFVEDKTKKSLVEEVIVDDKGTTKTCAVKGWRTKKQIQAYKAVGANARCTAGAQWQAEGRQMAAQPSLRHSCRPMASSLRALQAYGVRTNGTTEYEDDADRVSSHWSITACALASLVQGFPAFPRSQLDGLANAHPSLNAVCVVLPPCRMLMRSLYPRSRHHQRWQRSSSAGWTRSRSRIGKLCRQQADE